MLYKDTNRVRDLDSQSLFEHILQEGMGNPVELSSAPTTDGKELNTNDWGTYDSDLYINLAGTVIKFTGTEV